MKAVLLFIGAIAVGVLSVVSLSILHANLQQAPDVADEMPAFALSCIEHRYAVGLLVLPGVILSLVIAAVPVKTGLRYVLLAIGSLFVIACFSMVLYACVSFISPFYQYHPL